MAAPPRRQGVLLRQRVKVVTRRSSSNTNALHALTPHAYPRPQAGTPLA